MSIGDVERLRGSYISCPWWRIGSSGGCLCRCALQRKGWSHCSQVVVCLWNCWREFGPVVFSQSLLGMPNQGHLLLGGGGFNSSPCRWALLIRTKLRTHEGGRNPHAWFIQMAGGWISFLTAVDDSGAGWGLYFVLHMLCWLTDGSLLFNLPSV